MSGSPEPKRWKAVATYRSDHGQIDVEHEFEEIADLHDILERGPDWSCLIDVRITLARDFYAGTLTIERAKDL